MVVIATLDVIANTPAAISDDDHNQTGSGLCWQQQCELTTAVGAIWDQVTWRERCCQSQVVHTINSAITLTTITITTITHHHCHHHYCHHTPVTNHPPCRYIFTMLSPLARRLFIPSDENLLVFQKEDNLRIEPEWYCPVIPTVLANGCAGIGTGYSTTVPNYNPREIVANIGDS